jgi:hypothetical protein
VNAQFDYDGQTHTFQVSLGPRPDGRIGPPLEVIVDDLAPRQDASQRSSRRWRVMYDRVDAEHDRLVYCVIEVL